MLTINAQIKSFIDLALYRKNQISKNTPLYKTVDYDLGGVNNKELIDLLIAYPEGNLKGECCGEYDGQCDGVSLYYSYKRPFTKEEQEKENNHRVSNLGYAQSKIKKYMQRDDKNRDQVNAYLKAKGLEFILK